MAYDESIDTVLSVLRSEMGLQDADVRLVQGAFRSTYSVASTPELTKCNVKSAELRQLGNQLYRDRQYWPALREYNESICYADADSEHLSLDSTTISRKSSVYFEMGEYEYALYNIALAREHNCPERLLPKLKNREVRCKEKLDNGQSLGTVADVRYEINVDVNPRIPFLARGITMNQSGKGMVAQKDFQPGDVILEEKPVMVTIGFELRYSNCNYCGKRNQCSLIPCSTCVKCMYCSVDGLEEDRKILHRFECVMSTKLEHVYSQSSILGARLFFYGLTLFKDDLRAMMNYCNSNWDIGCNPFALDYTKSNLLRQYKELHKAKLPAASTVTNASKQVDSTMYYLICIQHPLLQSIAVNDTLRRFMFRCMLRYSTSMDHYSSGPSKELNGGKQLVNGINLFMHLIVHSCDPNVVITYCSDTPKTVVIRPIRRGEQIVSSFGPLVWERVHHGPPQCKCPLCSYATIYDWFKTGQQLPNEAHVVAAAIFEQMKDPTKKLDENISLSRDFIQRYAYAHPQDHLYAVVYLYRLAVFQSAIKENLVLNRARIAALLS